ncbi:unnamed protein product [Durusdinium trenchii]|uniref:Uncharacterized protein n=1 Tax=Durusdinium trenchii TaxID=1381693 RepID=A0ABP0HB53_9DINO
MRAGPKSGSMINRGRLVIFVAVATLLQLHQIAFLKPARLSSVRRPQVTMGARTPGNQPTDEPDYPEFKPTGDYLFETPFFKMEKFKQEPGDAASNQHGSMSPKSVHAGRLSLAGARAHHASATLDHGWRWEEANMGTVVCVAILLGGSARTGRVIWNMFPSSIRVR